METRHIFCDACEVEIDIKKDRTMGVFEYYYIQDLLTVDDAMKGKTSLSEDSLTKVKYDLCKKCIATLDSYIQTVLKKHESRKNN